MREKYPSLLPQHNPSNLKSHSAHRRHYLLGEFNVPSQDATTASQFFFCLHFVWEVEASWLEPKAAVGMSLRTENTWVSHDLFTWPPWRVSVRKWWEKCEMWSSAGGIPAYTHTQAQAPPPPNTRAAQVAPLGLSLGFIEHHHGQKTVLVWMWLVSCHVMSCHRTIWLAFMRQPQVYTLNFRV